MNDEQYIKLAIEEAKKSVEAGGAPIGAVMVKNGRMDEYERHANFSQAQKRPTQRATTVLIAKAVA